MKNLATYQHELTLFPGIGAVFVLIAIFALLFMVCYGDKITNTKNKMKKANKTTLDDISSIKTYKKYILGFTAVLAVSSLLVVGCISKFNHYYDLSNNENRQILNQKQIVKVNDNKVYVCDEGKEDHLDYFLVSDLNSFLSIKYKTDITEMNLIDSGDDIIVELPFDNNYDNLKSKFPMFGMPSIDVYNYIIVVILICFILGCFCVDRKTLKRKIIVGVVAVVGISIGSITLVTIFTKARENDIEKLITVQDVISNATVISQNEYAIYIKDQDNYVSYISKPSLERIAHIKYEEDIDSDSDTYKLKMSDKFEPIEGNKLGTFWSLGDFTNIITLSN